MLGPPKLNQLGSVGDEALDDVGGMPLVVGLVKHKEADVVLEGGAGTVSPSRFPETEKATAPSLFARSPRCRNPAWFLADKKKLYIKAAESIEREGGRERTAF